MANKKIPDVIITMEMIRSYHGVGDPNYGYVNETLKAILAAGQSERRIQNVLIRHHQEEPENQFEIKVAAVLEILESDAHRRLILDRPGITPPMISATLVLAQAICWTHS